MSDKCGNCDCADRSQCTKGNQYGFEIIETDMSYVDAMMDAENDGCKCGSTCGCTNCTCGCH